MRTPIAVAVLLLAGLFAWTLASNETRVGSDDLVSAQLPARPSQHLWEPTAAQEALLFGAQASFGAALLWWGWRSGKTRRRRFRKEAE